MKILGVDMNYKFCNYINKHYFKVKIVAKPTINWINNKLEKIQTY